MVFHRWLVVRELHRLKVFRDRDMRDAPVAECRSAGAIDND